MAQMDSRGRGNDDSATLKFLGNWGRVESVNWLNRNYKDDKKRHPSQGQRLSLLFSLMVESGDLV